MRIGSLCSGIGGLERGLELAGLGRTVWQSEVDSAASEVLARHWPGVENLGDFRGLELPACDVLAAGFPCQPVSSAGRRAGMDDERWLFDDIADAVGRMGTPPRLLVFENVRGLLSANGGAAMARVVHRLAGLGFVGRYGLLSAASVGCCHRRERVFFAAHADGAGLEGPEPAAGHVVPAGSDRHAAAGASNVGLDGSGRARAGWPGSADHDQPPPDTDIEGTCRAAQEQAGPIVGRGVADDNMAAGWGPYAAAVHRWEAASGRPAPAPTADGRLSPAFVEWMMGYPQGWVDGLTRTAALRCLGNAVVPQVAEAFGRMLLPTPTASQPGGTAEAHLARKNRDGTNRQAVTDLGMVVEQVLAGDPAA